MRFLLFSCVGDFSVFLFRFDFQFILYFWYNLITHYTTLFPVIGIRINRCIIFNNTTNYRSCVVVWFHDLTFVLKEFNKFLKIVKNINIKLLVSIILMSYTCTWNYFKEVRKSQLGKPTDLYIILASTMIVPKWSIFEGPVLVFGWFYSISFQL